MSVFPRPALRLHPPAPEVGADGPLSGRHPLGVSTASESSGRRGVLLLLLPLVFLILGRCGGCGAVPPAPSPFADAALHTCSSHPPCKDTESCRMCPFLGSLASALLLPFRLRTSRAKVRRLISGTAMGGGKGKGSNKGMGQGKGKGNQKGKREYDKGKGSDKGKDKGKDTRGFGPLIAFD